MDLNLILVCVVIAVALFFSYTNGFHDAANAIATSVSTKAWTPRAALLMAAVMNILGAMMGTAVAKTIGEGIISISPYAESPQVEMQQKGLVIILAALLGACIWNLITWWFGLPSSSSHALIGGMVGAGLMSGTAVYWWGIVKSATSSCASFSSFCAMLNTTAPCVASVLPSVFPLRLWRWATVSKTHRRPWASSSWLSLPAATAKHTRSTIR